MRFSDTIEVGDPVSQAKIYESQAVDELIFVDLDAARERRMPDLSVVRTAAAEGVHAVLCRRPVCPPWRR